MKQLNLLAIALGLSCLLTPFTASGEERKEEEASKRELATGFVPAFRGGSASWDQTDATGTVTKYSGYTIAFDVTAHWVLPGDRFAFGGSAGLLMVTGKNNGYAQDYMGYDIGPLVEVGIIDRLFVQARLQRLQAQDVNDQSVTGWKFGGGLTGVVYRNMGADTALQLDVMKTVASTNFATGAKDLDAVTITLGLQWAMVDD
jgi:hypothetical protein